MRGTGGVEVLHIGDHPDPRPKAGELLVRVRATALNRADLLQRRGKYPPPEGASEILGLEMAGEGEGAGPGCGGGNPRGTRGDPAGPRSGSRLPGHGGVPGEDRPVPGTRSAGGVELPAGPLRAVGNRADGGKGGRPGSRFRRGPLLRAEPFVPCDGREGVLHRRDGGGGGGWSRTPTWEKSCSVSAADAISGKADAWLGTVSGDRGREPVPERLPRRSRSLRPGGGGREGTR